MKTRFCPKTNEESFCELTDCSRCWHKDGMKSGDIIGGCGSVVRKEDNYVCPYFSRPEEWKSEHQNYGPCQIDLQLRTNKCLHAFLVYDINEE